MDRNLLIEERKIDNHRIRIYYDVDAQCPVTNWDMAAGYLFEYSDSHCLHSECNWKEWFCDSRHTLEEALRYMAAEVVTQKDLINYIKQGQVDGLRLTYNRHERQWELQHKCGWGMYKGEWITDLEIEPSDLKAYDYRSELVEQLEKDDLIALIDSCAKDFVIKEWGSCGYSQGDYLNGIAYMSKERYDKMVGNTDKPWKEHALELIDLEVKEIGMWAWGDVKGFILEKKIPFTKVYDDDDREDEADFEWEEVDSCWGYFMETEELINEVISEHSLKKTA